MTLFMRDEEMREEGRAEGREETKEKFLRLLIINGETKERIIQNYGFTEENTKKQKKLSIQQYRKY